MSWVLDHWCDLEADFLRFYRIEDMLSLDGPRFFRLAIRVMYYEGVMHKIVAADLEKRGPSRTATAPPTAPGRKSTGWQKSSLEAASPLLGGERREVRRG